MGQERRAAEFGDAAGPAKIGRYHRRDRAAGGERAQRRRSLLGPVPGKEQPVQRRAVGQSLARRLGRDVLPAVGRPAAVPRVAVQRVGRGHVDDLERVPGARDGALYRVEQGRGVAVSGIGPGTVGPGRREAGHDGQMGAGRGQRGIDDGGHAHPDPAGPRLLDAGPGLIVVPGGEHERLVGQPQFGRIGVQHAVQRERRRGQAAAEQALAEPAWHPVPAHQFPERLAGVGVGDDGPGGQDLPAGRLHARRPVVVDDDPGDLVAEQHLPAVAAHRAGQGVGQRLEAAQGIVGAGVQGLQHLVEQQERHP